MKEEDITKRIDILYKEFEILYKTILEKNNIDTRNITDLIDYTNWMKTYFKDDHELFNKVIVLMFDSKDKDIDNLGHLMDIYEKVKHKYE